MNGVLWSPDEKMIAYGYGKRVGVIDPSTGTQRFIGHGQLGAWSPDGNEIAVIERRPLGDHGAYEGGSVVAVPAQGGRPRLLIELPPA